MTDRILVTGAGGELAAALHGELTAAGYALVGADRVRRAGSPIDIVEADLTDAAQVADVARGAVGIVHLAAIRVPYQNPDQVVLFNNTRATFAVLQAAALLGIRRVVIASSIAAYGGAFSPEPFAPRYLPIDEDHPKRNNDVYGMSKEFDELLGGMFARRDRVSIAALRFGAILDGPADLGRLEIADRSDAVRAAWAGVVTRADAVRAVSLALEATRDEGFGFQAFNIVGRGLIDGETLADVARHLPETDLRPDAAATFSADRAARVLGWRSAS